MTNLTPAFCGAAPNLVEAKTDQAWDQSALSAHINPDHPAKRGIASSTSPPYLKLEPQILVRGRQARGSNLDYVSSEVSRIF